MDYRYGYRYREDDGVEDENGCASNFVVDDSKSSSKRGVPQTRGTAISFGFRRKSRGDNQHTSIKNYETEEIPQRSKSVGPEQVRRRLVDDDDRHHRVQSASSGRSTPRLAPPKKEAVSGAAVRTNRFGFRQPQARYTDKVADICSSHSASHFNQEKMQQEATHHISRASSKVIQPMYSTQPSSKLRPSPVNNPPGYHHNNNNNNNNNNHAMGETNRRMTGIPEPVSKYTLHTSHLPLPQYAVRVNDSNSKVAKTAANQCRKISTASKGSASSQSGSGTEDSGISSQPGYSVDSETLRNMDYMDAGSPARRINVRPRNLRMVVNGKSFDVRDVDNDSTVTEISVIALPKAFASVNLSTGLVRERTNQYQRITNKDNRYTESTTSMSTTSSEGYDEGLGEEKVYKDRSRSEKISSIKSDFSPPSSDDPEYGHGEAMADEYSFSSSDECRANHTEHLKTISNAVKSGSLPKSTLRSVLLTIEDPAFAAAAATSTTLIDDETSPVDSLVDSLTASITQSDGQQSKREKVVEKVENIVEDDSPENSTNVSNSLSLSEGREFFDDEIADQPGLTFDDTMRGAHETQSGRASQAVTDNSHTLVEPIPNKPNLQQGKNVESSPINCRRISRTDSVGTLSTCESITSDDLMLDYERSETSSYGESNRWMDTSPAVHEIDETTILSELEAQGEEVMRELSSLINAPPKNSNLNLANHNLNINNNNNNNNNNNPPTESGIGSARTSRLLRTRPGTESPRSLDSVRTRQIPSPFKLVSTGNGQSPNIDSGDEGSPRLERCNYHQDLVHIKAGLLKLMRIIQETEENVLTRADTLNPFNNSTVNGLSHNLNEDTSVDSNGSLVNGALNIADELADLRRQVIFLQGQVEDKDRMIQNLQLQVARQQELMNSVDSTSCASSTYGSNMSPLKDVCNAATQTEKIRPVSAGPSLLQSFPQENGMGPLVSWSNTWNNQNSSPQRPPSLVELNTTKNHLKPSDRLPKNTKSRLDTSNRLNRNSEKSCANNNSSVRQSSLNAKESVSNKIIDSHEFTKESSKIEIQKSGIPSFKKTTLNPVSRGARTDVSITGRSHNS
ncbi:probable serine/threonine-protein kinase DDB_G0282963 isoform X2 [Chelonus insularis]|uniref:probable serine/threonine-protein kinase DDB_G0282963 isoform X2 n=1 Tax=Chelonus insularis TaxID=460826 RepID=UPI00158C3153|nr:probable serine/threonine-protein kinase DDB_G0282963 isoform X2 [Chelonus insularis]